MRVPCLRSPCEELTHFAKAAVLGKKGKRVPAELAKQYPRVFNRFFTEAIRVGVTVGSSTALLSMKDY